MSSWKTIKAEEITNNAFQLIGKDWMLITAEKENKVNTMTASWGGVGVMWGKNVVYVVIRPQRYTKEFIDANTSFSLTFFPEEYKKQLSYLGSVSGKTEDKISKSELTIEKKSDIPYFSEGKLVLLCNKLFSQPLQEESFINKELIEKWYPQKDYHILYIAEIKEVLVKE